MNNGDNVEILVHADAEALASAVAERMLAALHAAQSTRHEASMVVTGGRIAGKIYENLGISPARSSVDWSRLDVWWTDERFVPSGDPDRNETESRNGFLNVLPIPDSRIHPMPAADDPNFSSAEAAADQYSAALTAGDDTGGLSLPQFDVLLLSIGEDGHVASIFPEHPPGYETGLVSVVHDSPKPPPVRMTLSMAAINTAKEVWILASGEGKADAVRRVLGKLDSTGMPAASVRGVVKTVWLMDESAAGELPQSLRAAGISQP